MLRFNEYFELQEAIENLYKSILQEMLSNFEMNEGEIPECGILIRNGGNIGDLANNLETLLKNKTKYLDHPSLKGEKFFSCIEKVKKIISDKLEIKINPERKVDITPIINKAIESLKSQADSKFKSQDAKDGAKLVLDKLQDFLQKSFK